jgi:DNA-binding transcriptional LysR family regulator
VHWSIGRPQSRYWKYRAFEFDLRQLRVLFRVQKLGSVALVAEELEFPPASISGALRELEECCGTKLLHSSPTNIMLTDAGQLVFQFAARIFDQASELNSILRELPSARAGRLTIGGSLTAGEFFLPNVIRRFTQRYPDVTLSLVLDNSIEILRKIDHADLDLGFVGTDAIPNDLTATPC